MAERGEHTRISQTRSSDLKFSAQIREAAPGFGGSLTWQITSPSRFISDTSASCPHTRNKLANAAKTTTLFLMHSLTNSAEAFTFQNIPFGNW
eukprot:3665760-Rhodomonas_salina.2